MKKQELPQIMAMAQDICTKSGGRLTEKRQRILELLLLSDTPLSAYELADGYNQSVKAPMPTMSVYRILEFLASEQLVHKLSLANKYIACSYIGCEHAHHEASQFLICSNCQNVKEIAISETVISELGRQVAQTGYHLVNSQLELPCLCENCVTDKRDAASLISNAG